jgi:hypothetical protein
MVMTLYTQSAGRVRVIERGVNLVTLTEREARFLYQNLKLLKSAFANL